MAFRMSQGSTAENGKEKPEGVSISKRYREPQRIDRRASEGFEMRGVTNSERLDQSIAGGVLNVLPAACWKNVTRQIRSG